MVPGWRLPGGGIGNGPEYAVPHAIIVDRAGRRFCNDSYWVDLVPRALDPADPRLPFFLVVDEQHHRKCGLGDTPPGGDYPDGLVSSAPTLRQLASSSASAASSWRARWQASTSTSRGEDPGFGRGTVEFINRFSGDPNHPFQPRARPA